MKKNVIEFPQRLDISFKVKTLYNKRFHYDLANPRIILLYLN